MAKISQIKLPDNTIYDVIDEKVKQSPIDTTTSAQYEILVSGSADNTEHTEGVKKNDKFLYESSKGAVTLGTRSTNDVGLYSFSVGNNITASGKYAFVQGAGNARATGNFSHAQGENTEASGIRSHAEGEGAKASGTAAHAEGGYTIANHWAQHALGTYNIADPSTASGNSKGNYVEIVGNGTSASARSNARTLDWSGNEVLAGNLTSTDVVKTNTWDGTNTSLQQAISGYKTIQNVAVASFPDGSDNALEACSVEINPVQDLHGYSKPWAAGAGKNKLDVNINDYTTSGVDISNSNGVITLSNTATANIAINLRTNRINVSDIGDTYKLVDDGSFTFSSDIYLNIRYYDSNGSAISNQSMTSGKSMNLSVPSNAYSFMPMIIVKSGIATNGTVKPMLMLQSDPSTNFEPYSNICPISGFTEANVVVSPTEDAEDGTTYTIQFKDGDNPLIVYGGTLNVRTGVLTVDKVYFDLSNSGVSYYKSAQTNCDRFYTKISDIATGMDISGFNDAMCDYFDIRTYQTEAVGTFYIEVGWINIQMPKDMFATGGAFKTWIESESVHLVYKLATPLTYQLTKAQVRSIVGQNYIEADSGNIIEIKYQPNNIIGELRNEIYDVTHNMYASASGTSQVSFSDGAEASLVECEIGIVPTQDLHGYSKPWAGGAGKNKLPNTQGNESKNGVTCTKNSDGTYTLTGTATASSYFVVGQVDIPAGTYTLSGCPTGGGSSSYRLYFESPIGVNDTGSGASFTISEQTQCNAVIVIVNGYAIADEGIIFKPMARLSSEPSTFEPYSNICPISGHSSVTVTVASTSGGSGEDTTVSLGRTVYRGTLDVNTGELTVTHGFKTYVGDASESWSFLTDFVYINISDALRPQSSIGIQSNIIVTSTGRDAYTGFINQYGNLIIYVPSSITSASDWKTWLSSNNLQILYELATPQTFTLTKEQIQTLLGQNYVSHDGGGTISLVYVKGDSDIVPTGKIGALASGLTIDGQTFNFIDVRVPQPPTANGTYTLAVTISNGTPTYSWKSST